MKRRCVCLLALLLGLGSHSLIQAQTTPSQQTTLPPKEKFHLYLLLGQSNMAGRGPVEDEDRQIHDRVWTYDSQGQWVPAQDPLHFDKPSVVGVGLGKTFGIELAKRDDGVSVGLIPCAAGGSPIASWTPGGFHSQTESHPYDDALRRAKAAMEQGELKGILWHQGESDCNAELATQYEQNLHTLIDRLRNDLKTPDLPFLVGQMGQFEESPWNEFQRTVDAVHRSLPDKVKATAFVSSAGLGHMGDRIHFSTPAYRELGKRFAVAYRSLVKQSAPAERAPPSNMNFVFFLVDDLGWADLGCFGSEFYETPNLDRLCASGMKFTHGYAACPVCSPTRASILTGRHPVRVDITDWIPGQTALKGRAKFKHIRDRDDLALEEVTIAEKLKAVGYQTFFAGKWHLGGEGHWPTDQGFDRNIGGCDKGSPPGGYYAPWNNPNLTANNNDEYLTERLTAESVQFLEQCNPEQPFLLYLSYYNVHTPITPYRKRIEQFRTKADAQFGDATPKIAEHDGQTRGRQDNPAYASMIAAVDDSVGEILGKLTELKLADNTTVFFFSDNGGLSTLAQMGPTCNLPLRAGKGWLYEGGVRVPTIIRVPGVTIPGSVCDTPIVSMDFFPTMLELAGLPLEPLLHTDGQSMLPLLISQDVQTERPFYWHYPHYHGSTWTPGASIRLGDWKLIDFYHLDKVELYNLRSDPGEREEIGQQHPAIRQRLVDALHQWQAQMGAKMPVPFDD